MATTDFTNGVTLSDAGWADDVDCTTYAVLTGVGGTANAITATGPATYSYSATRTPIYFRPTSNNTGPTTINVTQSGGSALGAKNIFANGVACIGGELVSGIPVSLLYDGTQFNIVSYINKGWFLLATGTASSSATLDFIGLTGYSSYVFVLSHIVPATDGGILFIRISVDNGANYKAGASDYRWAHFGTNDGGTNGSTGDTADNEIEMSSATGVSNDATYAGVGGMVYTDDLSVTTKYHTFNYTLSEHTGTSGAESARFGSGRYISTTAAINAVRFLFSTGNIAAGTIKCYGVR